MKTTFRNIVTNNTLSIYHDYVHVNEFVLFSRDKNIINFLF